MRKKFSKQLKVFPRIRNLWLHGFYTRNAGMTISSQYFYSLYHLNDYFRQFHGWGKRQVDKLSVVVDRGLEMALVTLSWWSFRYVALDFYSKILIKIHNIIVKDVNSFYLKSIANCWQWAESTILLISEFAASLISSHGRHSDIWSSRIETAQKACRLYWTWLDTANFTSVGKKNIKRWVSWEGREFEFINSELVYIMLSINGSTYLFPVSSGLLSSSLNWFMIRSIPTTERLFESVHKTSFVKATANKTSCFVKASSLKCLIIHWKHSIKYYIYDKCKVNHVL